MTSIKLPFKLDKPSENEYAVDASAVSYNESSVLDVLDKVVITNENYDTLQDTFNTAAEVIPSVAKEGYYVDASNNQYSAYTIDDVAQSISVTLWNSATSPQIGRNIPVYKKGSGNGTHTYLETMGIKMVATNLSFTGDAYDVYWYSNPGNFAIQVNGSTVYLYPQGVVLKDNTKNITLTGEDSWYICTKYIYDLGGYVNFYWKGDATSSTKIILAKELEYGTQTLVTPVVEDRGIQHKFTKVDGTDITLPNALAKVSDTGILADTEVSGATSIANAVNIVNKKVPTEYVKNTNLVDAGAGLNVFYNTDKTAKFTSYGSRPIYYEFYGMDNPVLYDCHFYQSSIEVEGYTKGWVKNPTQMYMSEGIVASNGSYIITEVSTDYTTIKCQESSGTTEYTYNKYSDYDMKGDYKLLSSYNLYCYKAEDASAPYQYVYAYTETPSPGTSGTDHRVLTCIADWGMSVRVAVTEEERIVGKKLSVEDETSTTVDDAVLVVQGVVGDVRKLTTTADNLVDAINEIDTFVKESGSLLVEITYSELKSLRDSNKLSPGTWYRITDYNCTTSQSGTTSAGHPFDIIVRADSASALNENAYAALHEGDTYFAKNNLSAWELKYCVDNDTARFEWANNTNGKGVIYWMKDEFGNECPYDFKNIQFRRTYSSSTGLFSNITTSSSGVACYTFSDEISSSDTNTTDLSLDKSKLIYNNKIKCYHYSSYYRLNNICFFGYGIYGNKFGYNCHTITFSYNCYFNHVEVDGYKIILADGCGCNSFGMYCENIEFKFNSSWNVIGDSCTGITFGVGLTRLVEVKNFSRYITLTTDGETSTSAYLQNIIINKTKSGLSGVPTTVTVPASELNSSTPIIYA